FTVAGTTGSKNVAIAFGLHLARDNEWGTDNGAHHYPGGSGKVTSLLSDNGSKLQTASFNPSSSIVAASSVQGRVYDDEDGNGTLTTGDVGIGPGVIVNVYAHGS